MPFAIVYITYPNQRNAEEITDILLTKKLAAGCNIFPIESSYWWKGSIQREGEYVSILQTSLSTWEQLKETVEKLHPYEVPCIIKIVSEANESYEKWVERHTSPDNSASK